MQQLEKGAEKRATSFFFVYKFIVSVSRSLLLRLRMNDVGNVAWKRFVDKHRSDLHHLLRDGISCACFPIR